MPGLYTGTKKPSDISLGQSPRDRGAVAYETRCNDCRIDSRLFRLALGGEPYGCNRHASVRVQPDSEMRRNRVGPLPSEAAIGLLVRRLLIVR